MKLSLNWLNDYIPIKGLDYEALSQKLIMFGFEDSEFNQELSSLESVVVGRILKIEKHPNADKLSYCQVDSGSGVVNVVCGAPNINEGDIVPLALEGAKLPNGVILKRSKIRGVESQGMMCSQKELLYGNDASGIFILPQEWEVGKKVKDYLNDYILSYEVKSNRPDLLSHVGFSRELSGFLSLPFLLPDIDSSSDFTPEFEIEVENAEDCGRYIGKLIQGVEVKQSGDLIKMRMNALGLQTRNNIVDISNYVLFELGHPVHIFDLEKIEGGKVIIRRARDGEEIVLLDGNSYKLDSSILVIADAVKPIAVAGVMGGLDSSVTFETKNIFIESAHFNPTLIRRAAKKLGLQTDASYRFERGTDIKSLDFVADRVTYLIKNEMSCRVSKNIDVLKKPLPEEQAVSIRISRTNKLLGSELTGEEIKQMLSGMHFKYLKEEDGSIYFQIPSYRGDVYREVDLIEEVGKLYGYNNLKSTLPVLGIKDRQPNHIFNFSTRLRSALTGYGLNEVINISIFTEEDIKYYFNLLDLITIRNPVGQFLNKLRPTLLYGLVRNLRRNLNRGRRSVKLFEIGSVFSKSSAGDLENQKLGILLSGDFREGTWRERGRELSFFDLKGLVEILCQRFRIKNFKLEPLTHAVEYIEGGAGFVILSGEIVLGYGGLANRRCLDSEDLDINVYLCELDLDLLLKQSKEHFRFRDFSRFPRVRRDLSLIFSREVKIGEVLDNIKSVSRNLIKSVDLFDMYVGEKIPKDSVSYAISIELQSSEKTLTESEIEKLMKKLLDILENRYGAKLREQ